MKRDNRKTGKWAEDLAIERLTKEGYQILERNWGNKFGEIDIIARDGEVLVFVEVKAKKGERFGLPEEMVGRGKLGKIKRMATVYLEGKEVPCRVDVVAIVAGGDGGLKRFSHYENVI